MLWYGFLPGWHIALLPVFVALAMLASLGPPFLITAFNVKYRDFRHVIPFIIQFGSTSRRSGIRARSCRSAGASVTA